MAKSSYYDGGMRFVRNGVPCKVASWVKDLSPISRSDMFRGFDVHGLSQPKREELAKVRHTETTYIGPVDDYAWKIAAAPDLLAIAAEIFEDVHTGRAPLKDNATLVRLRDAIAKAGG